MLPRRGLVPGLALVMVSPFAGAADPGRPEDPAADVQSVQIRLDADLGLSDIRLAQPRESRSVTFACGARWKPVEGSRLHLFLQHSRRLDAARSFLTVGLNDSVLRSIRLEGGEALAEVVIPISPSVLRRRNRLTFTVTQSTKGGSGTEVWTSVAARSYVVVAHQEPRGEADLPDLPLPLLDPEMPGPKRVSLLLPGRITPGTLEATALLVANLSLRAAPWPLALTFVRSVDEGKDPLVVVGTPAEQPSVAGLWGDRLAASGKGLVLEAPAGKPLAASTGVAGLASTGPEGRTVLYLTGSTPEAVLRAAWGVAATSAEMKGDFALVAEEPKRVARATRAWKGFIPPRAGFRLSEAGIGPLLLEGSAPLRLPIRATPDARFLSYGHSLALSLRPLPALLDQPEAWIEVAWNDVVLGRLAPGELARKSAATLKVSLPAEALRPENVLSVSWRGAGASSAAGPLASLDPEASEAYLPRDHEARLPDLALLRSSLYPFSLRADFSDVVLVVPDRITEEVFVLACEAGAFLGRILPTDLVGFRLRQPSTLTADERSSAHLILLRAAPGTDGFDEALPDWRAAPGTPDLMVAVLQEAESPWDRGRYVLSLRASSASVLLQAFRTLVEPRAWEQLRGDTAFLTTRGPVCLVLGKPRWVREVDRWTHVEAWLRSHWLAIPLVLTLASALLFVSLRLALAHRRREGPHPRYPTAASGGDRAIQNADRADL